MSRRLHKLIWTEGMYLAPHHFQAQSRFFEDSVRFVADCFSHFPFGFLSLEVDENELRNGVFVLHGASGVMPDGMVFETGDAGSVAPRDLSSIYPQTGQPLTLYLSVPPYREGQQNVTRAADGTTRADARFREALQPMSDFNTGQDLRPVSVLEHNLRVAVEGELGSGEVAMPLARIQLTGSGEYVLDPGWAPPCLQVSASPQLQARMERLHDILMDKSRSLADRRRGAMLGEVRHDPRELAEFWLLHAINSAIPLFRMWSIAAGGGTNPWKAARSPHPAELFRGLAQLAGALCTFVPESGPGSLPDYNHMAPGECFAALDEHIQRHLELGLPTNCVTVPLEAYQPLFYRGEVGDARCFGPSRWVLGVRAHMPETALIAMVPQVVKVSARDWIERVVQQQVPGVPLTYLPTPPPAVRPQLETVYFAIDQKHRLFEPVRKYRNIGIYVPAGVVRPELELHVVVGGTQT